MKKIIMVLSISLLQACSTTLPLNYIPSASIRGNGQVSIGDIHYLPNESGQVEANQFQEASAAIGDIYLSDTIPNTIKTALRKELTVGGYSVEPDAELSIEADVTRFLYDWIGFAEVDFYLDIDFRILKNGILLFTQKTASHQKAPKTMTQDTEAISNCIDQFFSSAHSNHLL